MGLCSISYARARLNSARPFCAAAASKHFLRARGTKKRWIDPPSFISYPSPSHKKTHALVNQFGRDLQRHVRQRCARIRWNHNIYVRTCQAFTCARLTGGLREKENATSLSGKIGCVYRAAQTHPSLIDTRMYHSGASSKRKRIGRYMVTIRQPPNSTSRRICRSRSRSRG